MRWLLVLVPAGLLFAQPDARELVRESIRNGERAWRQSLEYPCVKREIERQFDSNHRVKSSSDDVYEMIPLGYGTSFGLHVKHGGEPVPPQEAARQQKELAARRAESPAEKRRRFEKELAERSYMEEVPDAFDFKIVGTEDFPTGPAWVLEATPRPGYKPKTRYGHMFPSMNGKLWIDQKDKQWVKADAVATDTVSFGFFIARLAKGSHIVLEQMKLPNNAWVPKRVEAKASARTLIFFTHNFEEDITYSDYRWKTAAAAGKTR